MPISPSNWKARPRACPIARSYSSKAPSVQRVPARDSTAVCGDIPVHDSARPCCCGLRTSSARTTEELAPRETLDVGKPISDTLGVAVLGDPNCLQWYAESSGEVLDEPLRPACPWPWSLEALCYRCHYSLEPTADAASKIASALVAPVWPTSRPLSTCRMTLQHSLPSLPR